jgi:IS30 family transposase
MQYSHCTSSDRDRLQLYLGKGRSITEIAYELNKHISTLYRELQRNKTHGEYISGQAQEKSTKRRKNAKACPKLDNQELIKIVDKRLRNQHSPEQIAGRLKRDYPADSSYHISTETIYQHIYRSIKKGDIHLRSCLRHSRLKRSKRLSSNNKRGVIAGRTMIESRPPEVETKLTCGHWEGDTVEGAKKSGYLVTLVERKTKFLLAAPIRNKTSKLLNAAARRLLSKIPEKLRKTITVDNGKEFSNHQGLAKSTKTDIYFAQPYHSWERGLNEHTNGLLRQYFPKYMDLLNVSPSRLAKAVASINNRPRKCLNYRTPAEAFAEEFFALQT